MKRAWLLGLILAIPIIGFAVSEGIQAHLNSQLRTVIKREVPNVEPEKLKRASFDRACRQDLDPSFNEVCGTVNRLNLLSTASVAAAGIGLGLVFLIKLAGSFARTNRRLLLLIFKPGLYVVGVTLMALVLTHGAILTAALYYGESALFETVHIYIIATIGLGALAGAFAMAPKVFSIMREAEAYVMGKAVTPGDAPELWKHVDKLSLKTGVKRPDNIVLGLEPNFFVTEAKVKAGSENLSGRTLYCSLPLARVLGTDEFSAVIGHELGHYKGADTEYSRKFYPIYRGTVDSINSLGQAGWGGASGLALIPAIAIFGYFLECFAVAESRISRIRELAADGEGAAITSKESMSGALLKIHAFADVWAKLHKEMAKSIKKKQGIGNVSRRYAEMSVQKALAPNALEGIEGANISHPTDSHPPLAARLEALGTTIEAVSATSLHPEGSAIELFSNPERFEEELSTEYETLLKDHYEGELELDEEEEKKEEEHPAHAIPQV